MATETTGANAAADAAKLKALEEKLAASEKEAAAAKAELEKATKSEAAMKAELEKATENEEALKAELETAKKLDKEFDDQAKSFGEVINEQPKVKVKIPVDERNKGMTHVDVVINGYRFTIKRGEAVEVPESVAELLEQGGYI